MPYDILKLKKGQYEVVNTDTGEVHAKQTTLAKAKAQVRLLGMKHAKRGGATAVARMPDFSNFFSLENAQPPEDPPPPRKKRGDEIVPFKREKEQRFPSINQLIMLYGFVRPLFNGQQFDEANAELDEFIEEFGLDDEFLMGWDDVDPIAENVYRNIFQLVAGGQELFDAGYVAPANINALDGWEMGEILDGNNEDVEGIELGFDADDLDQMFGNGYYRMKDGCSLYTGGSHASDVDPINYNSELKNNSWLGYGYGGRGHVMPVNYNSEMTSLFNNF